MQFDSGGLVIRRAGKLGQARNAAIVDRLTERRRAIAVRVLRCLDLGGVRMPPCASQMRWNLVQARPSSEHGGGQRHALAARRLLPAQFQQRARQHKRAGAQILRRVLARPSSTASTSRASSAGPMPRPMGWRPSPGHDPGLDAESARPRRAGPSLEGRPRLRAAHLGGRSHRHVDHQMGGARGDLLGEDRGDHLAFAVDVQRALDADQNVVGGAQAAPRRPRRCSRLRCSTTSRMASRPDRPAPGSPSCRRSRPAR